MQSTQQTRIASVLKKLIISLAIIVIAAIWVTSAFAVPVLYANISLRGGVTTAPATIDTNWGLVTEIGVMEYLGSGFVIS